MPTTIERPPAAHVVAHATEYPPDRERREQERNNRNSNESRAERQDDTDVPIQNRAGPDAVVIAHLEEDHRLDGVSAYTHLGERALRHLKPGEGEHRPPLHQVQRQGAYVASEIRHAYEDHGGEPEEHRVNIAT